VLGNHMLPIAGVVFETYMEGWGLGGLPLEAKTVMVVAKLQRFPT